MCCTWLAGNRRRKKSPSADHSTTMSGYIFPTKACMDDRRSEKNLLNSNISSTCPHNMANFGSLAAEIGSVVWVTSANFNGFHILASLLQRRDVAHRSPSKLCMMFGRLLGWYNIYIYIYIFGGLLPLTEFFPVQRATPIFSWAAITLGIGPHSS